MIGLLLKGDHIVAEFIKLVDEYGGKPLRDERRSSGKIAAK